MTNRKPDYILKAINKVNQDKSPRLGAAWINTNGTVSIIMDVGCTIGYDKELTITLFKNDGK
jgi:hypothetical protein